MSRNESHNLFVLALNWNFDAFASLHLPDFLGEKTFFGPKNIIHQDIHIARREGISTWEGRFSDSRQQLLAFWFII
jgi:hypothetical protein